MLWACINGDLALEDVELLNVRNFIVTDGSIKNIDDQRVLDVIRKLNYQKALLAGTCAGFDCRRGSKIRSSFSRVCRRKRGIQFVG